MTGFNQETIDIEQVSGGIYTTLVDLTYTTKDIGDITVPKGYKTDGYSKPRITEILVGGRFEDDIRPSTLHDYLCQNLGFYRKGKYFPLSFNAVNNLFYEAMLSVGIPKFKAILMRIAVQFNPNKW